MFAAFFQSKYPVPFPVHIIVSILTIVGVIALILWRVHAAYRSARALDEAAQGVGRYLGRRRTRLQSAPGGSVEDPREAAAAMMVAIAQSDGALSDREQAAILEQMRSHFESDAATTADLFARGRWLAREVGDLHSFLKRLTPPVARHCTPAEQRELIDMLAAVAGADGPAGSIEAEAVHFVARQFGLRA